MLGGCLGTFLGSAILVWALIDLNGLLDERRGWVALIAAPIAIVVGIRRIRRAKDAP